MWDSGTAFADYSEVGSSIRIYALRLVVFRVGDLGLASVLVLDVNINLKPYSNP